MTKFFLVCLGGAIGSGARFGVSMLMHRVSHQPLPLGTFLVNFVGSLLFTCIVAWHAKGHLSSSFQLFLCTGVLGGFTTYSAFNYEVFSLLKVGLARQAFTYVAVTWLLCLLGSLLGWWLAQARW